MKRAATPPDDATDDSFVQDVDRRRQRRRTDDDFPGDDGEFYRSSQRVKVRKGILPQTRQGWIITGAVAAAGLAAIVTGTVMAHSFLLRDSRFRIATSASVEIAGNSRVSRPQMLSIFGEDVERNVFRVPLEERRSQLESLPWVEHATVMRLLPDRIRVSIVERTPVAYVRQGGVIGLVDANGVILDLPADAAGDPKYSFPVVTGINQQDPAGTRSARMKLYQNFIHEVDSSGPKISEQLSEVDLSNPEDVKALIPTQGLEVLVHFGDDKFLERYQKFEQHMPEWKQQYPRLASADMRYETQVVLEMAKGAEASAAPDVAAANPTNVGATSAPVKPAPAIKASEIKTAETVKPAAAKSALTAAKATSAAPKPAMAAVEKPVLPVAKKPVAPVKSKPVSAAPVVERDTSSGIPDEVADRLAGTPKKAAPASTAAASTWRMKVVKPGEVPRPPKDPAAHAQTTSTHAQPKSVVP